MGAPTIYATVQQVTARQRELAQGQARQSRVRYNVIVTGVGETRLEAGGGLFFGGALLEEPTFSFGVTSIGTLPDGCLPLATACVLRYKTSQLGMFLGCDMGFKVESALSTIRLRFSLTFEGVALRTTAGLTEPA